MPSERSMIPVTPVQSNLSRTTDLNVKEKWSFQTGGRFNLHGIQGEIEIFRNLKNGLSRVGGLSRGGSFQTSLKSHCIVGYGDEHRKCLFLHFTLLTFSMLEATICVMTKPKIDFMTFNLPVIVSSL